MDLSFSHPVFAILFLLLPLIWFLPSRPRSTLHGVIRTLILALVVLALMQPVLVSNTENKHFVIVIDQSDSVAEESKLNAATTAKELTEQFREEGEVTVIQLGGLEPVLETKELIQLTSEQRSPLSDALELAAQAIPWGVQGSITILSDGMATDTHWSAAIDHLTDRGIPVHSSPLEPKRDVYLSKVKTTKVQPAEEVTLSVTVIGAAEDLTLSIKKGDEILAQQSSIVSDGRKNVDLSFTVDEPGFIEVIAELDVPERYDSDPTNNQIRHVITVQDPVKTLYVGSRQTDADLQLSKLLGAGFTVEARSPTSLTEEFDFTQYDVVMLDDVPASLMPPSTLENLAAAVVNDGVGMIHSGGESAFGDGGYHDTPITELLPVEIPGDQDKIDPSVGLAIILDTSGSMAGTRIELAKHIARIAVRRMQPHDRIGIVEFYGNKHWAVPMQPATNKIEIDRAIGRMKAIGGTVLYPAIQEAYYGLQNVNTRYKHIILITDAGVEDSNYEAMVRKVNKDRITLSTILVGQGGHNQIMSDIANWGGGRFYSVGNQFQLVELIFKQSATKKSPMYKRGRFDLEAHWGRGWWGDVEQTNLPPLRGYVEVETKDQAEVLLEVTGTQHPILASWRYGLGRVTAMMTEPVGGGTRSWAQWEDYPEFLGRIVRRTATEFSEYAIDMRRRFGTTTVLANRNVPDASQVPALRLFNPESGVAEGVDQPFKETAPGLFELDLVSDQDRDLYIEVSNSQSDRRTRIASLAGADQVLENQVDPMDALDLPALSSLTGGVTLTSSDTTGLIENVSAGELSFIVIQVWPWLLLLALLMYIGDIVYRRWPRTA